MKNIFFDSSRVLTLFISVTCVLCQIFSAGPVSGAETGPYGRFGMGGSISEDCTFRDESPDSTNPPALFGRAVGEDGRSIGARGDFGESFLVEAGLGWQFRWFHAELNIGYRPGFEFSGDANFLKVPLDRQPVEADLTSLTGMFSLIVALDRISPASGGDLSSRLSARPPALPATASTG